MHQFLRTCLLGVGLGLAAGDSHASLEAVSGGLAVYDTTRNLTWTADANLFLTQARSYAGGTTAFVATVIADSHGVIHDTPNGSDPTGTYTLSAGDFDTRLGALTFWGAEAGVNYLNVIDYAGSNHWALPSTVDRNSSVG
jgi:hypothetical protein